MKYATRMLVLSAILFIVSYRSGAQSLGGKVLDSLDNQVLPSASVSLEGRGDIKKMITEENGLFLFADLDSSVVYRLEVAYAGFRTIVLDSLRVCDARFLTVALAREQKEMQAVVLSSVKPAFVMKNDKIILNIAQSPVAGAGNVYEAVTKVPGIVDAQGLQFRGRNVTVYIDGRPSRMGGEELRDYLAAMPANTVERIEVIPNPTARYEASGGPVVNLVLARPKELGTNGVATGAAGAGRYGRYNGGISLNHRSAAFNVYGSYDHQQSTVRNLATIVRDFKGLYLVKEYQHVVEESTGRSAKLGIDLTPGGRSSMGGMLRGNFTDRSRRNNTGSFASNDSSSTVAQITGQDLSALAANLYYRLKTGKEGELSVNADFFSYEKKKQDGFVTRYYGGSGLEYAAAYLTQASLPASNRIRSIAADYHFSSRGARFETGMKAVLTRTDNGAFWDNQQNGEWTTDLTRSNRFIYKENIYAGYFSAAKSFGSFDLDAGLRMELTGAKGYSVTLKQENNRRYLSLFPSVSAAWNQSEEQQYSFSYRRRIERFGFDIVNPFVVYQNRYAYYQGNPDIRPSYSDNFSLGWTYGNNWMASADYSHFTDALAEVYRKEGNDKMVSSFENIASADQLSVDLSYSRTLFAGKLNSRNSVGGVYAKYNASAGTGLNNAAMTVFVSSSNIFSIGKWWRGELSVYYYSPMRFGAYSFRSQFSSSAGLSRSFWKKRANLGLSLTDIFGTAGRRYTAASYGVSTVNRQQPETRFFKLSFSYKFGKMTVKNAKSRQTAIEDIKKRMEAN